MISRNRLDGGTEVVLALILDWAAPARPSGFVDPAPRRGLGVVMLVLLPSSPPPAEARLAAPEADEMPPQGFAPSTLCTSRRPLSLASKLPSSSKSTSVSSCLAFQPKASSTLSFKHDALAFHHATTFMQ